MTSRFLVSALFVVSGSAFAADAGSQFQHQTPADKMELTPALGYDTMTTKNVGGSKDEGTGMHQRVMFEYGISEQFSAGAILENSSSKPKSALTVRCATAHRVWTTCTTASLSDVWF